jgi:hypothetical protein
MCFLWGTDKPTAVRASSWHKVTSSDVWKAVSLSSCKALRTNSNIASRQYVKQLQGLVTSIATGYQSAQIDCFSYCHCCGQGNCNRPNCHVKLNKVTLYARVTHTTSRHTEYFPRTLWLKSHTYINWGNTFLPLIFCTCQNCCIWS